jgi:hypothetical protein
MPGHRSGQPPVYASLPAFFTVRAQYREFGYPTAIEHGQDTGCLFCSPRTYVIHWLASEGCLSHRGVRGPTRRGIRRPDVHPEGSASQKEACRPKPARKTGGACTHEQRLVSVALPAIGLKQGAFTRPLLPYGRLPTKKSCRSLEANAGASVCQRYFQNSLTGSHSGPTTSLEGRLHACAHRLARLTCIQGKREMVQFPSPRNAGK